MFLSATLVSLVFGDVGDDDDDSGDAGAAGRKNTDGVRRRARGPPCDVLNYFCVAPGDPAFELCVVSDIGLKTGWVRCRHGRGGRGGGDKGKMVSF